MADVWQPNLVSAVVPTYNRGTVLERVLAGFAQQTLPATRFEVIVVDDGGSDGSARAAAATADARPYRLRVLHQPNRGPAAARNTGLRAAEGQVVVFVDDDCVPTPALLAGHAAAHEVPGLAAIGRMVWHPEIESTPFQEHVATSIFTYAHIGLPFDAPFICYYTGNASVHRQTALDIGGFDETFPFAMHEDIEFAYRLRRAGARFVFAPEAVVLHYRREGFAPFLANQRGKGREMVRLLRLHPELHDYAPLTWAGDPRLALGLVGAAGDYAAAAAGDADLAALVARLAEGAEPACWADERVATLEYERAELRQDLGWLARARAEAQRLAALRPALERRVAETSGRAASLERAQRGGD